ncbi:MAG: NAD(P)-dependent oxidoreductase [Elusimicrobia bacterium]|nr:NAD(P)-dependent oxidoreductase [Elusimicrobiota bacterium]
MGSVVPKPKSQPKTIADFPGLQEMVPAMRKEEARVESSRCLTCFDAPCVTACPTHIDIPRFIRQINSADPIGSAVTILEANPLGHSCARVCPVEALCEGSCVYMGWHEKPIQIGRLQRYATDVLHGERIQPFTPGKDAGKKAAVIGAGPSGLSCAAYLRRLGVAVTVFEAKPMPGGLNTYGIAEYKLSKPQSLEETELVLDLGADVRFGVRIGKDIQFDKIVREFDAVFLGVGLGAGQALGVPGEHLPGVYEALPFIERIKAHDFSAIPTGSTTVCIGAGNTAVDVVTQAKRLGTPKVVMAYRRGPEDMPAYEYEYDLAKGDAVEFLWHVVPVQVLGTKAVTGIRFARVTEKGGKLVPVPKSEFDVPCDRIVKAIGQKAQGDTLRALSGLDLDPKGRVVVDAKTLATSNKKVWAGGDAINGGKEVVNAAADGKRAALSIYKAVTGRQPVPEHGYWISTIEGRGKGGAAKALSY